MAKYVVNRCGQDTNANGTCKSLSSTLFDASSLTVTSDYGCPADGVFLDSSKGDLGPTYDFNIHSVRCTPKN
jgi:hypothetical protein